MTIGEIFQELTQEIGIKGELLGCWGKTPEQCAEAFEQMAREAGGENPWLAPVAEGVRREILERGYSVVLVGSGPDGVRWAGRAVRMYGEEECERLRLLAHREVRFRRKGERILTKGAPREALAEVVGLVMAVMEDGEEITAAEALARLEPRRAVEA